jgi:hypothetical protein
VSDNIIERFSIGICALSKKKYMSIADASSTTASRDITQLIEIGCIRHIEGTQGRNVRYEIVLEIK